MVFNQYPAFNRALFLCIDHRVVGEGSGDKVVDWALEPLQPSNTNGVVLHRRGENLLGGEFWEKKRFSQ